MISEDERRRDRPARAGEGGNMLCVEIVEKNTMDTILPESVLQKALCSKVTSNRFRRSITETNTIITTISTEGGAAEDDILGWTTYLQPAQEEVHINMIDNFKPLKSFHG